MSDMTKGSVYRLGRGTRPRKVDIGGGRRVQECRTKDRGTREKDGACGWKAKHAAMYRDVRGRSFRGQGQRGRGVVWLALRE